MFQKEATMQELLLALKEKYNISDEDAQKVVAALMEMEKQRSAESKTARRSRGLMGELFGMTETLLSAGVKSSAHMMGIMGELLDSRARGSTARDADEDAPEDSAKSDT
jgi:hypothetical protein